MDRDARRLLQDCGIDPAGMSDEAAAARAETLCRAVSEYLGESSNAALFDAHVHSEFVTRDIDATMETMTDEPRVIHVPTLGGGDGTAAVRDFYQRGFIPQWPDDTRVRSISRTIGQGRLVDELIVSFTHDREFTVYAPGIPPSGRRIDLPHVVITGFENGKVAYEHIYWDQASMLAQMGVLDAATLPVLRDEAARKLIDPDSVPANPLADRAGLGG